MDLKLESKKEKVDSKSTSNKRESSFNAKKIKRYRRDKIVSKIKRL